MRSKREVRGKKGKGRECLEEIRRKNGRRGSAVATEKEIEKEERREREKEKERERDDGCRVNDRKKYEKE